MLVMWIEICCFCCAIVFNVDLMHSFLFFKSFVFFLPSFFSDLLFFFFFPFFSFSSYLFLFSFFFLPFFLLLFLPFFLYLFLFNLLLSFFLFPFFHSFFVSVNDLAFVYAINYMEGIVSKWRTLDKRKKMSKKYEKDTMRKKKFFYANGQ